MRTKNRFHAKTKQSFQKGYVMCGRKASFPLERIKGLAKSYNQRYYECPYCEYYHLTKKVD